MVTPAAEHPIDLGADGLCESAYRPIAQCLTGAQVEANWGNQIPGMVT